MAFTTLTLAGLMLAPTLTPSDVDHINSRDLEIPVRIDPSRQAEIKELILHYSSDLGQTWQQASPGLPPSQTAFTFHAPNDGQYWFQVSIVDKQGNRQPPDVLRQPPSRKIEVDTTRPVFNRFNVERQGDEIVVDWDIKEDHLDWNFFKLDHRGPDASESVGTPVLVGNPAARGQARFRHAGLTGIIVRMEVQDLAGNRATTERTVGGSTAPRPNPLPPADVASNYGSPPPGNFGGGNNAASPTIDSNLTRTSQPTIPSFQPISPPPPIVPPQPNFAQPGITPSPPGAADSQPGVVAATGPGASFSAAAPPSGTAASTNLPGVQVTNQKRFGLDFEVPQTGPSGVGAVELYISPDNGQTWNWKLQIEQKDLQSPVMAGGPYKGVIPVELPHEGVFGFRLVVRNGAGLSKGPPQPSDPPELRIEYDATLPFAQLYMPRPEPGKSNALVLTWTASDKNLDVNPITLEWSADPRPTGAWNLIGTGKLANSGRCTWEVPPGGVVPPHVYLRLTVRDAAGNVSQAITREPIVVDLHKPEAVLKGIAGSFRPL